MSANAPVGVTKTHECLNFSSLTLKVLQPQNVMLRFCWWARKARRACSR
jgi:hypothetical protein